jgi:hypothetical protein
VLLPQCLLVFKPARRPSRTKSPISPRSLFTWSYSRVTGNCEQLPKVLSN